ncbi:MAG: EAL domain-containing protein [Gemmatimonadota bacterium]
MKEGKEAKPKSPETRVMVVGDGESAAGIAGELLVREGYRVDVIDAGCGPVSLEGIDLAEGQIVLSDLDDVTANTVDVLRSIRRQSRATPFILLSTDSSVQSAVTAFDSRAFVCVKKPVESEDLLRVVRRSALQQRMVRMQRETVPSIAPERTRLAERFDNALASLWIAYQPIIDRGWRIIGYEALLRTEEPTLRNPPDFLQAAADLGRVAELAEHIWLTAVDPFLRHEPKAALFMNVDPNQLMEGELFPKGHPVRLIADRVVFEVRAQAFALDDTAVLDRLATLRARGFRVAVDDLGAGSSGLAALAQLEPDFVKLDGVLVRGVENHDRRQRLIRSLSGLCVDLGIECIASGVETRRDFETLTQLGCTMFQGFFVGRPMPWGSAQTAVG